MSAPSWCHSSVGQLGPDRQTLCSSWDDYRLEIRQPGDHDNPKRTPRQRAAKNLAERTADNLFPPQDPPPTAHDKQTRQKVETAASEALEDYATIYLVENLIREYLRPLDLSHAMTSYREQIDEHRRRSVKRLRGLNRSHDYRLHTDDLWWLGLAELFQLLDTTSEMKGLEKMLTQTTDERQLLQHLRHIVMHTAGLTPEGRTHLASANALFQARLNNLYRLAAPPAVPCESTPEVAAVAIFPHGTCGCTEI